MNKGLWLFAFGLLAVVFSASCVSDNGGLNYNAAGKTALGNDVASEFYAPWARLTQPSGFHWFAYYDKLETDPTGRYVLAMRTDFEGRSPTEADTIELGVIDTQNDCSWKSLGRTSAWGWQQGCQFQFIPKSDSEVIWNDREGDKFVAKIMNIKTGEMRTIPSSIYALSPDGKWAITVDYARVNDMRPGYGYKGSKDEYAQSKAPAESGIWKVDLETGKSELLVSLAEVAAIANPLDADFADAKHWFNHLLVSPDGKRIIFLHRWKYPDEERTKKYKNIGGFGTRMFTISADGKDLRAIDPYNYTSHFIWNEQSDAVLAWTKMPEMGLGFFLIKDSPNPDIKQIGKGVMTVNGHCTYLKGGKWILNDTYPDKNKHQTVYLYNVESGKRVDIAKLYSPKDYKVEWRCDTHPRATPDGTKVILDSPHENGRQVYIIDVSEIVGED